MMTATPTLEITHRLLQQQAKKKHARQIHYYVYILFGGSATMFIFIDVAFETKKSILHSFFVSLLNDFV